MTRLHLQSAALYAVFFLSGVCGLAYQVIWSRMFTSGLGHEIPAILAVVASFFGGLAVGAWLLDRPISSSQRPGRWYVLLEVVIGVWGLSSLWLIPRTNELASGLIGLDPAPWRHWLVAFALPFVVLFPATLSIGATLPAMERFVAPLVQEGRCVGALYAANTLGAAAGVLVSTLVIVPDFGFSRSVVVFACLNLCCAALVLIIDARSKRPSVTRRSPAITVTASPRLGLALFATGLLGIGFEVLGVRLLAQVLENTVYTFAITLVVYLLGTALGAAFQQWCFRSMKFAPLLSWLLGGLSTSCVIGAWMLTRAPEVYQSLRSKWGDGPTAVAMSEMSVAAIVFGLPTLFMGATFSHLVQSAKQERGGIGRALALNTLGSATAPALFGVALLPHVGTKWSFVLVALGYVPLLPRKIESGWLGVVVAVGLSLLLPANLRLVRTPPASKLVEFREGVMDSVAVIEHADGNRTLLLNNRFAMGGTGSAVAERRHAQLPLLLHPQPRRALFLGLGTAITFAAAGAHPDLVVDGVELVPEVVEAMPQFKPYNDFPTDGFPLRVHVADARRFVRVTDARYDVIVADLFHPARDGAGTLYTREHFQIIRSRLDPDGLFCQWLPLHQLDEEMLRVITRTFLEVFPDARAWLLRFNVDTPVLGLIGTLEPTTFSAGWLERRVGSSTLRESLKPLALTDDFQLFGCLIAGAAGLRDFCDGARINTDDCPVVVFGAPKFTYQRATTSYGRLFTLLDRHAADPGELIQGGREAEAFRSELSDFIAARDIYLRALVRETEGQMTDAVEGYVESARRSSHFSTGYARCLTIAAQLSKSDRSKARALLERLIEAQPERPVARQLLEGLLKE
jgi:spermidine synthase